MKTKDESTVFKDDNWLSDELRKEVVSTFEPLYKRSLTNDEVTEIANNLSGLAELWVKFNLKNI